MNVQAMQEATRDAVKTKFHGKRYLVSRSPMKYPQHLERDYTRITNAYMGLLNDTLREYIPEIKALLDDYRDEAANADRTDAKRTATGRSSPVCSVGCWSAPRLT